MTTARRQDGQNETEQSDHSASLGDSAMSSTRTEFSVHTGLCVFTQMTINQRPLGFADIVLA
jgi:hypothetical protein